MPSPAESLPSVVWTRGRSFSASILNVDVDPLSLAAKPSIIEVTGGGTGLGLAPAKAFAHAGAKIFISSLQASTLEKAKTEIESIGSEVDFVTVDVTDSKSVEAGVGAAVKRFGKSISPS
ncbi:hypothetical protein FRB98_008443 [Tulasnella sp. 332]|nr:hypothetical protein FRB98_008443 [Tulasnella sp. 332]